MKMPHALLALVGLVPMAMAQTAVDVGTASKFFLTLRRAWKTPVLNHATHLSGWGTTEVTIDSQTFDALTASVT